MKDLFIAAIIALLAGFGFIKASDYIDQSRNPQRPVVVCWESDRGEVCAVYAPSLYEGGATHHAELSETCHMDMPTPPEGMGCYATITIRKMQLVDEP